MFKKKLPFLALLGVSSMSLVAHADQPMSSTQAAPNSSYNSGERIKEGQLPGGYNQSADYKCDNGWDVYLTGDYIFWDWVKDGGMNLGLKSAGVVSSIADVDLEPANITPGYASGFQVGLGFNMKGMDDWNFYSEYTWYKNSGSNSSTLDAAVTSPSISIDADLSADISIKYSNADFLLQRPFYFGKKLTANFYTGLKALWITTTAAIDLKRGGDFSILSPSFLSGSISSFSLDNKTSSWGLGPKFGVDSNWLLGYGFKIMSNVSASVLYTRYTQSAEIDTVGDISLLTLSVPVTSDINAKVKNYGTIRPMLESYLGLGWGAFFCDNNCHFDLSVGYDFNVYFNYITVMPETVPPVSMYLHGLNVQARFDF